MTGAELKRVREGLGWTQAKAASQLGLSQPYLSLLEGDRRLLTEELARKVARVYAAPSTFLPLDPSYERPQQASPKALAAELAALGYPGFSYLRSRRPQNPAAVLLKALSQDDLESRLVEALPWVVWRYPRLAWDWLVPRAKLYNLQNRLGYVVHLAGKLAETAGDDTGSASLRETLDELEKARLAAEGTLCNNSLTPTERSWLRKARPPEAAHWNLLTDLRPESLSYASC